MNSCSLCDAPKAGKLCGECGNEICKNCVRYLANDHLRFHPAPPPWAQHGVFCVDCFDTLVAPEVARYDEVAARSESVKLVFDTYRGYIPCLKKAKEPTNVNFEDQGRGIALHRLQFLAAWSDYDALIDVSTTGVQVRNHGYQSKVWSATGTMACIDYKRFRPEE